MHQSYRAMSPQDRYLHDPTFNKLVDSIRYVLNETEIEQIDLIHACNLAVYFHETDQEYRRNKNE